MVVMGVIGAGWVSLWLISGLVSTGNHLLDIRYDLTFDAEEPRHWIRSLDPGRPIQGQNLSIELLQRLLTHIGHLS